MRHSGLRWSPCPCFEEGAPFLLRGFNPAILKLNQLHLWEQLERKETPEQRSKPLNIKCPGSNSELQGSLLGRVSIYIYMLICLICIDIRFCYSLLAVEKLTSLKLCSHQAIEGALSVSFYVLCSSLVHSLLLRQFSQFHSASARPSKCLRHAARAVCRTSTNMYSTQCTSDRNVLLMCASDSVSRISVLNLTSPFECKCTVYIYIPCVHHPAGRKSAHCQP